MKNINVVMWKENRLFVAKALEVEVASQGYSEEAALANLKEALELYFADQTELELTSIKNPKLQNITVTIDA